MKPSKQLHFGWVIPLQGATNRGHIPFAIAAERRFLPPAVQVFDSLWVYDHLYAFGPRRDPYLESWTTLTWLAARVPKVQLGTLVLGVGYRPPALLAKMAATLQTLSGGRLVLGLGAGWREEEYPAYGYPYPKAAVRVAQLREAIQIIRAMWTERDPKFHGKYFSIDNAYCFPQPEPPPPLMIGGSGEQLMLPLIGEYADWWNVGALKSVSAYRSKLEIVRESAARAGRDPQAILLSFHSLQRKWPRTQAEARGWVDFLSPLVELGWTHFMINGGPPASPATFEQFAERVIEPLRQGSR